LSRRPAKRRHRNATGDPTVSAAGDAPTGGAGPAVGAAGGVPGGDAPAAGTGRDGLSESEGAAGFDGGWTHGVRLGVDVGTVRVGVAICDPDGILATPLVTLGRDATRSGDPAHMPADMRQIARLVAEHGAVGVVVGLPVALSGIEGPSAIHARTYAQLLAELISPVPIDLADERMSTAAASRRLSEVGVRGKRQRAVVDQAAAVEILQRWLDTRRRKT
jgi:putative Holliday junction resolvase